MAKSLPAPRRLLQAPLQPSGNGRKSDPGFRARGLGPQLGFLHPGETKRQLRHRRPSTATMSSGASKAISWLYIYLLIEFQSTIDPWMALRVMTYTASVSGSHQVWTDRGQWPTAPGVFPLVLYNGLDAWTARQDIAELIAPMPATLAKYRPNMRYFILMKGRCRKQPWTRTAWLRTWSAWSAAPARKTCGKPVRLLRKKLGERNTSASAEGLYRLDNRCS